jgi:hypothetical protein
MARCITPNCPGTKLAAKTISGWNMPPKQYAMREAINAVELALNNLEIDSMTRLMEGAHDSVMVKVPLGALRRLARCYPELNRIINDPEFERG